MLHQYGAVGQHDTHDAVRLHLEGLVVRAVLFGLLCHQANVRYAAHGHRIKGAVGFAEVDHLLVDASIGALRHHRFGVFLLSVFAPHLTRIADHGGHGGVDDHITRDVQVGDAFDRVNHRHFRTLGIAGVDVVKDLFLLGVGQRLDLVVDAADSIVRINAQFFEELAVLVEDVLVVNANGMAEDDRMRDFHHGRLDVQGPHDAGFFAILQRLLEKFAQLVAAHEHAVEHFAFL